MRFGIMLGTAVTVAGLASSSGAQEVTSRFKSVPLGGTLVVELDERQFGVHVPTQFGGVLTIETTKGQVGPITGPDGRERSNGEDVGVQAQGWYTFEVNGAQSPFTVSSAFIQVGESIAAAMELLLLADQVRRDPRALGGRQRTGRHHAGRTVTT